MKNIHLNSNMFYWCLENAALTSLHWIFLSYSLNFQNLLRFWVNLQGGILMFSSIDEILCTIWRLMIFKDYTVKGYFKFKSKILKTLRKTQNSWKISLDTHLFITYLALFLIKQSAFLKNSYDSVIWIFLNFW